MKCPICYYDDTKVIDSRVASDGLSIRRRRECEKCGFRFSTFEEMEILDLTVVKRGGQKEAYNRDKLISGLKKSLEKRPVDNEEFKKLVHNIERDILELRKSEVDSSQIGEIAMKHLRETDVVAYIRFASVYESFDNARDFKETLNKILEDKKSRKKK
jgi:transcriptional repressor NrdR